MPLPCLTLSGFTGTKTRDLGRKDYSPDCLDRFNVIPVFRKAQLESTNNSNLRVTRRTESKRVT
eukprot:m.444068 g.444068  ORF g.444068 m.444068 type:complete len:64 (+) comp19041_c0_seq1:3749-3940(+)